QAAGERSRHRHFATPPVHQLARGWKIPHRVFAAITGQGQCVEFEVPIIMAARSFGDATSKTRARIIKLLVEWI
ncbi:MAG: hypothetical protein ACXU84_19080, partial [Xanthobacteraceae bacterium]